MPFFSILIPAYNRPQYLKKCIDSILNSTFQDFEIIISDDNSPRSEEIKTMLSPYIDRGQVEYHYQEINLREPNNKNFLNQKASGDYNIFLVDEICFSQITQ